MVKIVQLLLILLLTLSFSNLSFETVEESSKTAFQESFEETPNQEENGDKMLYLLSLYTSLYKNKTATLFSQTSLTPCEYQDSIFRPPIFS